MQTTTLVQMKGLDALRLIISRDLELGYDASQLQISPPTALGQTATSVEISVDRTKSKVEYWEFTGTIPYTYERLDIESLFGSEPLNIKVNFPVYASEIMKLLCERLGIGFENCDFIQEMYQTSGIYTLQMSPESYRWTGSFKIQLNN